MTTLATLLEFFRKTVRSSGIWRKTPDEAVTMPVRKPPSNDRQAAIAAEAAANAAALQTVFFTDGEFKVNYLVFLSLQLGPVQGEIEKLRSLLAEQPTEVLERDIICMLTAENWRFHNVACVAIAIGLGLATDRTLASLWKRIHRGSWVSPQLVATAAYVDTEFEQKALQLMGDHGTFSKSVIPLAEILCDEKGWVPVEGTPELANLQAACARDLDNSGKICLDWLASLRTAAGV